MKYCKNCGTQLDDGALYCTKCGANQQITSSYTPIPQQKYNDPEIPSTTALTVWSVINLLFCLPLGIFSLVLAINAKTKPYETAVKNIRTAKILNIVGLVLGVVAAIIMVVLSAIGYHYMTA